jgi:hypothetical protein
MLAAKNAKRPIGGTSQRKADWYLIAFSEKTRIIRLQHPSNPSTIARERLYRGGAVEQS